MMFDSTSAFSVSTAVSACMDICSCMLSASELKPIPMPMLMLRSAASLLLIKISITAAAFSCPHCSAIAIGVTPCVFRAHGSAPLLRSSSATSA